MYTIKVRTKDVATNEMIIEATAGQTLLEVLLKNNIDLPHECGGMCYCSTCHIWIKSGSEFILEKSKRETDFLNKAMGRTNESRLACQCLLVKGGKLISIEIPSKNENS